MVYVILLFFYIYTIIEPSNDKSNNAITIAVVVAILSVFVVNILGLTGKINYELLILLLPLSGNNYQEAKNKS